MSVAFHDGDYLALDEVRISPLDRGFLFGDGVYEVVPVYGGQALRLERHLDRLWASLGAIRLEAPMTRSAMRDMFLGLIARNGGGDQAVYLQVTRGAPAVRNHAFPSPEVRATVFGMSRSRKQLAPGNAITAITRPDQRWGRCDIKAVTLLPNVLARQDAVQAGAQEAILLRGQELTEGAATNVFVVDAAGTIATPPLGKHILPGITRELVIELARADGMRCEERALSEDALRSATEIVVTSSTLEAAAVTHLDGTPVGGAVVGPVAARLQSLFRSHVDGLRNEAA